MKTIDGIDDAVRMEVHRGGGHLRDSSIWEGGAWTAKDGVARVRQAAFRRGAG